MSSTHPGSAKWTTCWRQASYLCKHIYKDPPGPAGFQTFYPDKMAEIERNWETWDLLNNQAASGLVARFYKVKSWNPADKSAPSCPPCLVFRGTDFEDMRDLGIAANIRVQVGPFWKNFPFNKIFDPNVPARNEEMKREEMLAMGFKAIGLLDESGRAAADGVVVNLEIKADIMAKENGDWVSNLYQGLGRGSPQYSEAMAYGRRCVDQKILPLADKRMEISGHSLGGGLAAAVCCHLDHRYPQVTLHAMIFNPAGVNPKTIAPASTSSGSINAFAVKDEVLTTLQSHTTTMPFIGAVFRHASRQLGMAAMPPSLGTMRRVAGRSPGGALGAKGTPLPDLFPMRTGNRSSIPVLAEMDGLLLAAPNLSQYTENLAKWLRARYEKRALEDIAWYSTVIGKWSRILELWFAELRPELALVTHAFKHSAEYHGMDVVIASYEATFPA